MSDFPIHTVDSAPEGSRETLEQAKQTFGMVPNLLGVLANAPAAAQAYTQVAGILEESSFSPEELQTILLAVSVENECHYCVAAHSALAAQAGLPEEAIEDLRNGEPLEDDRLEALRRFAEALVRERGWVGDDALQAFLDAGYSRQQVLETVTAAALKTLSNYVNHLAETPVDGPFERWTWSPEGERKSA
ncbi:MAG: carboxymuconolactone decarboxylase family protein [Thermoanaerobaculia bacterium]